MCVFVCVFVCVCGHRGVYVFFMRSETAAPWAYDEGCEHPLVFNTCTRLCNYKKMNDEWVADATPSITNCSHLMGGAFVFFRTPAVLTGIALDATKRSVITMTHPSCDNAMTMAANQNHRRTPPSTALHTKKSLTAWQCGEAQTALYV